MSGGALEKVMIVAYKDKEYRNQIGNPYYLPVNPESYSSHLKIDTDNRTSHGEEGTDPRYISTPPEDLKLDFIIDGTGSIENYRYSVPEKRTAQLQLDHFLEMVYEVNGKTHCPNKLKVHWGESLVFSCMLSELQINYQLFEPTGEPLRIKISATFRGYRAPKERAAKSRNSSPDLTHLKEVRAGDRLDVMTHSIYNDTKHLLQVARVNDLTSIRTLKPGAGLRFPPITKSE